MIGITQPIHFNDIETMNQFYSEFEEKAINICEKYEVPQIWDNARIYKNNESFELSIISLGSYLKGSKDEKAINEIIKAFNDPF